MKYKIIFGIIIPLILIISLAVISNLVPLNVNDVYVKQLSLSDLFENNQIKNSINIGDVNIENTYFLQKRYSLNTLGVCLISPNNANQIIEAGTIEYSEGDSLYQTNTYNTVSETSVEVNPGEKKDVKIYFHPSYMFSYKNLTELSQQYKDYDELVIYEKTSIGEAIGKRAYYCTDLNQAAIDKAAKIEIIKTF